MTPRTRTSNKDTNFTPYFLKKGPKQQFFPHRRKVVRRPDGPEREYKQMKFLPEKMRPKAEDWQEDSEEEEDVGEEGVATVETPKKPNQNLPKSTAKKGNKRGRDAMENDREAEEYAQPTRKRRRAPASKNSQSPTIDDEHIPDDESTLRRASPSPSESELHQDKKYRRRRQSTMTQLVEGRRPDPDDDEPEFRAVQRKSRTSTGRKHQDNQQRTLTQMVPGLVPLVLDSDDDLEDTETDGAFDAVLAEQLTKSGVFQLEAGQDEALGLGADAESGDEDHEDTYEPTQIVRSPAGKRLRTSRRVSGKYGNETVTETVEISTPKKKGRLRFSLLATPERRKVCEIASSQSPPESPLSTQTTPGTSRLPLSVQTGNGQKPQDTPSKRKQVTFQDPATEAGLLSSGRRKFDSMVFQDSDEEEEEEEFDEKNPDRSEGQDIGAETQAILEQIDLACAYTDEDGTWQSRDVSEERIQPIDTKIGCHESFELHAQQNAPKTEGTTDAARPHVTLFPASHTAVKQEPRDEVSLDALPSKELDEPQEEQPENESNLCSSPLVIKDESDDEDAAPPTPPQLPTLQDCTDLDGEPIQAPRSSPPVKLETQETACSHSSKAEEQIQSEWLSYSQYQRHRAPPESSMFAIQGPSSYQVTTFSDSAARTVVPPQWSVPLSQATTVDPTQRSPAVTPRKPHSRFPSANTTPHKFQSSQPPPLIIPSSFPSPQKGSSGGCGGEWSSPVLRSQFARELGTDGMGSIENFTIPPLPPSDDDEL